MKKKILATTLLAASIATVSFAQANNTSNAQEIHNGMNTQMMQNHMNNQSKNNESCPNMHKGMMGNSMMNNHMSTLSKLNLTSVQKTKLTTLHKEMMNKMQEVMHSKDSMGMMDFISKNGFDKESFKKTMNNRHQTMIDFKINHMEKVSKIFTKEQLSKLSK